MADPSNSKEGQALVNKLAELSSNMRQTAALADNFAQSIIKLFPNSVTAPAAAAAPVTKKRGRVPKEPKKVKDPNAPKRPATSYIYFQNDIREELKAQYPGMPYKELLGKVSEAWQSLDDANKKQYQDMADVSMAEYNRAVLDYKGTAPNGHAPEPVATEPTPEAEPEADEEEEEEEDNTPPTKKQKAVVSQPVVEESSEEETEGESEKQPTPPPPPPPSKKTKATAPPSAGKEKKKAKK